MPLTLGKGEMSFAEIKAERDELMNELTSLENLKRAYGIRSGGRIKLAFQMI